MALWSARITRVEMSVFSPAQNLSNALKTLLIRKLPGFVFTAIKEDLRRVYGPIFGAMLVLFYFHTITVFLCLSIQGKLWILCYLIKSKLYGLNARFMEYETLVGSPETLGS